MDNKTLTCFALLLLLGCALGGFKHVREKVSAKFRAGMRYSDLPTQAPRNCDPKRIPRFRNFDASVFDGVSRVAVLATPRSTLPDLADRLSELQVLIYTRPDGTREQILVQNSVLAQDDGTCQNDTNLWKFGQGRDSSVFMRVNVVDDGMVITLNLYILGIDLERGETAIYSEWLFDGVYDDDASFIFITTQNPSVPVDLTQSAISEGLVQFCGEEALEEDFFEKIERNDPIKCWG